LAGENKIFELKKAKNGKMNVAAFLELFRSFWDQVWSKTGMTGYYLCFVVRNTRDNNRLSWSDQIDGQIMSVKFLISVPKNLEQSNFLTQ